MKIISHLLLLIIGAGIGVMWGVRHPNEAANLAAQEKQAIATAKIKILEELHSSSTPVPTTPGSGQGAGFVSGNSSTPKAAVPDDKVQQMLDQSHRELDEANKALQNQN